MLCSECLAEAGGQPASNAYTLTLAKLGKIELWDLQSPNLYTVHVQLLENGAVIDEDSRRIGFRKAIFTDHGFSLNAKIIKLHGLDRHQTFPFAGQAMPARAQRQDAKILRYDLRCTSSVPRTTRNRATFSTPATNLAC